MKKLEIPPQSEHKLLSRLQVLGAILFCFGFMTLSYMLFFLSNEPSRSVEEIAFVSNIEASGPIELAIPELKKEILYLGIAAFWIIGAFCFLFARKRKAHSIQRK